MQFGGAYFVPKNNYKYSNKKYILKFIPKVEDSFASFSLFNFSLVLLSLVNQKVSYLINYQLIIHSN